MATKTVNQRSAKARPSSIRLTRRQYRQFAEQTKAVGLALNVSSFERMGCWGAYSPWAMSICKDATAAEPKWDEHAMITLASSVNTDKFRAAGRGRPELDWSGLEDHEIYPFIVQHEIGHRQNNFDAWLVMTVKDQEVRDKCRRPMNMINEVLADRYAWKSIRPGEPIPLSETGKRLQERVANDLAYLEQHLTQMPPCRPEWQLAPGPYCDVPDYMLAGSDRAAFLGPEVNQKLVAERAAYYEQRNQQHREPLF